MKLNKYLKIFVVCFCLVALLAVSCFATSAHTTNAAYGHYISPGEYVFNEVLTGDFSLSIDSTITRSQFHFIINSTEYFGLHFMHHSTYDHAFYITDPDSPDISVFVYNSNSGGWLSDDFRYITVLDGFYIYNSRIYQWWQSNVTRVDSGYSFDLLDGFLTVFSNIGVWISSAAASLTSMFFAEGSLTFLGTLCIAALAMAVSFLFIGLISRFLRFRG